MALDKISDLSKGKIETAPFFKLIFFSVLGLTALSLGVNVSLVFSFSNPSQEVKSLIETCSTTWKLGFGALLGLIGGKGFP